MYTPSQILSTCLGSDYIHWVFVWLFFRPKGVVFRQDGNMAGREAELVSLETLKDKSRVWRAQIAFATQAVVRLLLPPPFLQHWATFSRNSEIGKEKKNGNHGKRISPVYKLTTWFVGLDQVEHSEAAVCHGHLFLSDLYVEGPTVSCVCVCEGIVPPFVFNWQVPASAAPSRLLSSGHMFRIRKASALSCQPKKGTRTLPKCLWMFAACGVEALLSCALIFFGTKCCFVPKAISLQLHHIPHSWLKPRSVPFQSFPFML